MSFASSLRSVLSGPGLFRLFLAWVVMASHTMVFRFGTASVYLFFVLSGYWICAMWEKKYLRCSAPYRTFMVSRFWRLIPVLLICNLLMVPIVWCTPGRWPPEVEQIWNPLWWVKSSAILFSSWQYLLLAPAWSLDAEMRFYFLAPILLLVARWLRTYNRLWSTFLFGGAAFLGMLAWALLELKTGRNFAFFFVGCLAYESAWIPSRSQVFLSLGAFAGIIVASFWYHPLHFVTWGGGAPFPPDIAHVQISLSIVVALALVPWAIHTVHQRSPMADRSLGDLAYSLYLVHPVVISFGHLIMPKAFAAPLTVHLVSFLLAFMIYRYLEQPVEVYRRRFVDRRLRKKEEQTSQTPPAPVLRSI